MHPAQRIGVQRMLEKLRTDERIANLTEKGGKIGELMKKGGRVIVPLVLVFYVVSTILTWAFHALDHVTSFLLSTISFVFPIPQILFDGAGKLFADGVVLVLIISILLLVGGIMLTKTGQWAHAHFEKYFEVLKFVGAVYKLAKEVVEMMSSEHGSLFYKTVIVPLRLGDICTYRPAILLGTERTIAAVENGDQDAMVDVFFAHAPSPASGNVTVIRLGDLILTEASAVDLLKCGPKLGAGTAELVDTAIAAWRAKKLSDEGRIATMPGHTNPVPNHGNGVAVAVVATPAHSPRSFAGSGS